VHSPVRTNAGANDCPRVGPAAQPIYRGKWKDWLKFKNPDALAVQREARGARNRAEKARSFSDQMNDKVFKQMMLMNRLA